MSREISRHPERSEGPAVFLLAANHPVSNRTSRTQQLAPQAPSPCGQHPQNDNVAANFSTRGAYPETVPVTWPKFVLVRLTPGFAKFGWFSALNASARSCNESASCTGNAARQATRRTLSAPAHETILRRVAISCGRRLHKGARVKPLLAGADRSQLMERLHLVWHLRIARRIQAVGARRQEERRARCPRPSRARLPATSTRRANVPAAAIALSLPNGSS